jgi:chemotaxis protein MotB
MGRSAALLLTIFILTGCITRKEHDQLIDEAAHHLASEQARHQLALAAAHRELAALAAEIQRLQGEISERDAQLAAQNAEIATLQKKHDDAVALGEHLRATLERAGKSVDQLVSEKSDLARALEENKARLEELRKAQEAAQKRADLFKNLLARFKKMIDAGDIKIVVRDGRMVLQLRNDVLFDSGRVDIKGDGKKALKEVAKVLASLDERAFQVAGHTDNVPIATSRFPSNWELSTARAVEVVKFLIAAGVPATRLSGAGYGEFDPVAKNDAPEGRARNRRIEIVLQPDISELVQVPLD